jgi:flagellar assembly protein FliH
LSRVVGRDGLRAGDVRSYQSDFLGAAPTAITAPADTAEYRAFEFESLDVIKLAPLLLLMAAQEKAREMISEAEVSAAQIRRQTLEDNLAEGREDAKRELLPSLVAFADAGQSLIIFEEQLVARYTPHIVELALEIAEKVTAKAVVEDPEIITSVLERAKHEIVDAKQIRIWLNPADYQILAELRPDLIKTGDEAGRTIEVAASDTIARGGCRLETESGLVDATVPTQIEEIRRQLLDEDVSPGRDHGASIAPAKT